MNVIDFNKIEHGVTQKPVPTYLDHALARLAMTKREVQDSPAIHTL